MNLTVDRRIKRQTKGLFKPLLLALEYREKETEFEDMQRQGIFPRGDPSHHVIQLFEPKATEISQNMPKADESYHIVFKQVPRSPFPIVALSIIPSQQKVNKIIRLPNTLQMSPFSEEAFQYVWLHVAYNIHLGRVDTGSRTRPSTFTVPNSLGNRAFASFLQNSSLPKSILDKLHFHRDKASVRP